jgi:hypothetical protein
MFFSENETRRIKRVTLAALKVVAMIQNVQFSTARMTPGEVRDLTVWADGSITVDIKCFVWDPPPAGFKSCSACGTFPAANGTPIQVVADEQLFMTSGGRLNIALVEDTTGATWTVDVDVFPALRVTP